MAYLADWVAQRWIVIKTKNLEDIAAGNRLKFEGDGLTASTHKLINLSTEMEWTSGFSYSSGPPEKATGTRSSGNYELVHTARTSNTRATIEYRPTATGGASWTAQEGG